jgi:hypothetical protein
VVEYWKRYIGTSLDNPDITETELAQFRGQVSNPDDVQQFVEYLDKEEGEVDENFEEGEEGEEGGDDSDDVEDVISEEDGKDNKDEDEEMGDFIIA